MTNLGQSLAVKWPIELISWHARQLKVREAFCVPTCPDYQHMNNKHIKLRMSRVYSTPVATALPLGLGAGTAVDVLQMLQVESVEYAVSVGYSSSGPRPWRCQALPGSRLKHLTRHDTGMLITSHHCFKEAWHIKRAVATNFAGLRGCWDIGRTARMTRTKAYCPWPHNARMFSCQARSVQFRSVCPRGSMGRSSSKSCALKSIGGCNPSCVSA